MKKPDTLEHYLQEWAGKDELRQLVAYTVAKVCAGTGEIAELVAQGDIAGMLGQVHGDNADGDAQKELDIRANDLLIEGLNDAPVAYIASEELEEALELNKGAPLSIAFDPLDGSSNIDTNVSVGTIFSIFETGLGNGTTASYVLQPGNKQLAAGYVIYGPQTALVLTVGEGTHVFTLDPKSGEYLQTKESAQISLSTREFAINVSNFRHWDSHVRTYIDDCLDGKEGVRGESFNMRWVASLVAECHRILSRGGIFLYPGDQRKGYSEGRLRLVYEANPIAWLVEQAGGEASTGHMRIMDIQPTDIHQRTPFIFGSKEEVDRLALSYEDDHAVNDTSPLFATRGLFRA
ncbi:MAG: class 1 fructose-bisphosphatase [Rhodospirillales bacterium]|nr:class 1 fructose-bisphosphatase [Rhodospirillales bacterium]